jgi:hypothetical protein
MIAIFNTEVEAIAYSNKIHSYLLSVRPNYNAIKWATPEKSADGLTWSVKTPIEYDDNRWGIPLNVTTELVTAKTTASLPAVGGLCTIGNYYLYKGDILKCRQTHNRTIYEPKDTPALFSFFRDNSLQLEWIVGEQVEVGWMRIYSGVKYEVIQAHQTQSDWAPDKVPALWKVYVDPTLTIDWKIGIAYKVGDEVMYLGKKYRCRQAHTSIATWNPVAAASLWLLI